MEISATWIISLFTQVIPLELVQDFLAMFWKDEWLAVYRLIMTILQDMEPSIL